MKSLDKENVTIVGLREILCKIARNSNVKSNSSIQVQKCLSGLSFKYRQTGLKAALKRKLPPT